MEKNCSYRNWVGLHQKIDRNGLFWKYPNHNYGLQACANPITVTRIFSISQWDLLYIKKTTLRNQNSPFNDTITKTGVANALEQNIDSIIVE